MVDRDLVIQGIYEAAAIPERWPAVLEQMGRLVGTPGVGLLTRRSDAWTGYSATRPIEEAALAYFSSDIGQRSDTTRRLLEADHAGFLSNDDLFSPAEWELEPLRNEWGRRWGYNSAAATAISVPSGDFLVVQMQRREQDPPFNAADIVTLDSFRPHLARAGLLTARWRMQRLTAATEALSLIGLPAAVVDRNGRALAANALIENMTDHVRWLARERLALVDRQANALLLQALSSLFDPKASTVQSIASRPGAGAAAVIHVVPTAGQARDIFDGGLAVLAITPVATPDAPDGALVRALFDLSATEARVARSLTQGRTVDQIAIASGVSRETIRTQLKSIMAKTGTRRQAEMTALLAGLPRLPLP
jgi:DNA-binding CsgD family transcriptional regulator